MLVKIAPGGVARMPAVLNVGGPQVLSERRSPQEPGFR